MAALLLKPMSLGKEAGKEAARIALRAATQYGRLISVTLEKEVREAFICLARRHAERKLREAANVCDLPVQPTEEDDWQRGYNAACGDHKNNILALSNGAKRRRK